MMRDSFQTEVKMKFIFELAVYSDSLILSRGAGVFPGAFFAEDVYKRQDPSSCPV